MAVGKIIFKQKVTPEDLYLGVDPLRHAGISCSDELVLKVTLPETKLSEIDLDVRPLGFFDHRSYLCGKVPIAAARGDDFVDLRLENIR